MPFTKLEKMVDVCKAHHSALNPADPDFHELEFIIVSGLVLQIISEYESMIEDLFIDRASLCSDPHVENFVRVMISEKFRSPDIGKITEILGKFGRDYRSNFENNVLNTDLHAAWDNIMRARHAIVHQKGTLQLTFNELITSYPKTKTIFSCLRGALTLPAI